MTTTTLLAKYRSNKKDHQFLPHHVANRVKPPTWWDYDFNGCKWVMVEGKKRQITEAELTAFVISNFHFDGVDENGPYVNGYTRKGHPRLYPGVKQIAQTFGEQIWWAFSLTLDLEIA